MAAPTPSVFDPLTGLVSMDYLTTRLGEVYRAADVAGTRYLGSRLGRRPGRPDRPPGWDRMTPLILAGDAMRTVFDGGQTLARLSDHMAVALTEREEMLARRTQLLAGLVTQRLVRTGRPLATSPDYRGTPLPRVWIEKLPDSQTAAVDLIRELGGSRGPHHTDHTSRTTKGRADAPLVVETPGWVIGRQGRAPEAAAVIDPNR